MKNDQLFVLFQKLNVSSDIMISRCLEFLLWEYSNKKIACKCYFIDTKKK